MSKCLAVLDSEKITKIQVKAKAQKSEQPSTPVSDVAKKQQSK